MRQMIFVYIVCYLLNSFIPGLEECVLSMLYAGFFFGIFILLLVHRCNNTVNFLVSCDMTFNNN